MDATDFRILARLFRDPLASHAEIGRQVNLTIPTVSRRLDRLREEGVLRGVYGRPAAEVFGRTAFILVFGGARAEEVDLKGVLRVDPVVWAVRHHDGSLAVLVYLADQGDGAPPALIDSIGVPSGSYPPKFPIPKDPEPTLSPLDWRILEVLVPHPRASITELSNATGLTPKTVRRRRGRLLRDGYLLILPIIEASLTPGLLVYNVTLFGFPPEDREAILRVIPQGVLINESEDEPMLYLLGRSDSLSEMKALEGRLQRFPGLEDSKITLVVQAEIATDRLLSWIRSEREKWERARRGDKDSESRSLGSRIDPKSATAGPD